ncbi:hypothetical protein HPB48_011711 [Haemaphysalis longicornis]|uniref:Uncharacterized protein n=1 Tax=Haemaphysalis longicornis TaxID=44386 RepID=A0A9J6H5D2_HAELO|nr:hypothetical protein HPB48_011711 [Haemaphysalis longicornis]
MKRDKKRERGGGKKGNKRGERKENGGGERFTKVGVWGVGKAGEEEEIKCAIFENRRDWLPTAGHVIETNTITMATRRAASGARFQFFTAPAVRSYYFSPSSPGDPGFFSLPSPVRRRRRRRCGIEAPLRSPLL